MVFREMRRKRQALSQQEITDILHRGTSGVLALLGDEDYPYAVPLSYVYVPGKLYFHSALSGHKIDALHRHAKASFCVIDKDQIVPDAYTTYFRSVIVFGRIQVIDKDADRWDAIEKLAIKYAPKATDHDRTHAIRQEWNALCLLEMTIEHMTGKEAIELVREKRSAR